MMPSRNRFVLCEQLNLPSTASLCEIKTALEAVVDDAQRAALHPLLDQLVATETQPLGGWSQ